MRIGDTDLGRILEILVMGGWAYFSTYHEAFWQDRLKWFQEQADKGLLGEIDYAQTKDGVIVCHDGFRATTQSSEELIQIGRRLDYPFDLYEVDRSSLFLVIQKGHQPS